MELSFQPLNFLEVHDIPRKINRGTTTDINDGDNIYAHAAGTALKLLDTCTTTEPSHLLLQIATGNLPFQEQKPFIPLYIPVLGLLCGAFGNWAVFRGEQLLPFGLTFNCDVMQWFVCWEVISLLF